VKIAAVLLVLGASVWAQGWGYREAMLPWVQGRFIDAGRNFTQMRPVMAPPMSEFFLAWEAEFEIERGRFGTAASLLREAKKVRSYYSDSPETLPKRFARLYFSAGQFAEAERAALNGHKWDGKEIRALKVKAPMSLVTIGEVYLARGVDTPAAALFAEASKNAKKTWSLDGLEWIRAQIDLATLNLRTGQVAIAAHAAELAFATASQEWGAQSIPAMDALDMIGVVRTAESKFSDAETALSQSRAFRERLYGSEHPKVADSYLHVALLRNAQHDQGAAVQLATRSAEIQKAASAGGPNGRLALTLLAASEIFATAAHINDAKECYRNAIPVLEAELGHNAPTVEAARKRRHDLSEKEGKD
jgi:hypothetical protein